ncbi:MAG: DegT/DnrJ/EryC1/StrS family aminotransferase [Lachnospiraceae bacterium]
MRRNKEILVTRSSMPPLEEYIDMIRQLWDSHWITNMGALHNQLEKELEIFLGEKYVQLTVNGHMALELAIQSMGFPEGSEVITTPFTFVSTTYAIIRNRLEPVFCDIKEDFTIDESKIEELITEKTVAIVPVHVYGNPCDVEKIEEIAKRHGLKVIYDAAHAFGERYHGKGIGTYGDLAIFSFHATKVYNAIEGGAVCCRNEEQYKKIYNLKNFGIQSEELVTDIGSNAKMNEFSAAMGLCNLKYFEQEREKRKRVVAQYKSLFHGSDQITFGINEDIEKSNYAYFPVIFETKELRNKVYENLAKENIRARKYFYPLTSDVAYFGDRYFRVDLKRARYYSDRILVLPLYADLLGEDVERITSIVKQTV